MKDNGVYHKNMFPPSNWTLYSMPSQLMGVNIINMLPKHDTLIFGAFGLLVAGPNSRHHEPLLCAYLQFITIDTERSLIINFFS